MILSDYGKGLFQFAGLAQAVITIGRDRGIPVLVDPKGRDWERYRGATCITPNRREMELYDGSSFENRGHLESAMARAVTKLDVSWLLVTRGAAGMCVMGQDRQAQFIPSRARQVFDVSGAGDTVIATLALAVASQADFTTAAKLANLAAGVVVGKVGTQPIHLIELQAALRAGDVGLNGYLQPKAFTLENALTQVEGWRANQDQIVFTNGCFDLLHPGHIHLLNQAKGLGQRLVVDLNADASVRRLKGSKRPILNEQD